MSEEPRVIQILGAEFVGHARHGDGGVLRIGEPGPDGEGVVEINLSRTGLDPKGYCCWWDTHTVGVYVRRSSDDLSVIEIHMARHDGLAQEELDRENAEAQRYPLGPKEYWRAKQVGKYTYGADGHLMTNEEFEDEWWDDDEDDDLPPDEDDPPPPGHEFEGPGGLRGFIRLISDHGDQVELQQSSALGPHGPYAWLRVGEESTHLTLSQAAELRTALDVFLGWAETA